MERPLLPWPFREPSTLSMSTILRVPTPFHARFPSVVHRLNEGYEQLIEQFKKFKARDVCDVEMVLREHDPTFAQFWTASFGRPAPRAAPFAVFLAKLDVWLREVCLGCFQLVLPKAKVALSHKYLATLFRWPRFRRLPKCWSNCPLKN